MASGCYLLEEVSGGAGAGRHHKWIRASNERGLLCSLVLAGASNRLEPISSL